MSTVTPSDHPAVVAARMVCPISDVGWLEATADLLHTACSALSESERDLVQAQKPHWHALNRAARINRASERRSSARARVQRLLGELREQTSAWQRGQSIYA